MRILSGVQPSGNLHIGNYFGAIRQFVALQEEPGNECYYFLADLHAMTTIKDGSELRRLSLMVAADYIALGLDPARSVLYRQSDILEVAELAWMLSTVTPMGLLQRGHSYKDKIAKGITPNHGLFAYPVLMAADILIVRADRVPVGKDQKQHLEMTRDIAGAFNQAYGAELLRIPEELILPEVAVVPGVDGQKMSKSYGNTIDIFAPESELRKRIMSIVTDSTPVAEPKPTRGNSLYALLKLFTPAEAWPDTKRRFTEGGTGYGELKKVLLGLVLERFGAARRRREELLHDPGYVQQVLRVGRERAMTAISEVMTDCRRATGLGW
ncbi:MAG: tryptophan--tRNA ligase [Thermoanaerobaculaceae bacterium]|nr:tryptophan--tRNA ligase [Thermoanaerobaculaceae bacterium]MDI9620945.1 tryptophan--tRNA ligase [Acidobacteriota bacterium]NLH09840.1 tryptophan--tRNA ligase [Holophagae bacterium]HPW56431.1 tryptophan--tRNA ligase [Thermoanaerobaculaceae bacterium]